MTTAPDARWHVLAAQAERRVAAGTPVREAVLAALAAAADAPPLAPVWDQTPDTWRAIALVLLDRRAHRRDAIAAAVGRLPKNLGPCLRKLVGLRLLRAHGCGMYSLHPSPPDHVPSLYRPTRAGGDHVVDLARTRGVISPNDLATWQGVSPTAALHRLQRLVALGRLVRLGRGAYAVQAAQGAA